VRCSTEMVPSIRKTSDLVQEIAAASSEQSSGVGQINSAMGQLNQATQQNASASEELAATAEELGSQAEQLQQTMTFFRLDDRRHAPRRAAPRRRRAAVRRHAQGPPARASPPRQRPSTTSNVTEEDSGHGTTRPLPGLPTRARRAAASAATEAPAQYLTFVLGGEMFAVGILNVKEIIEYGQLTEIPMMPAFIRGVINLRGSVVPVDRSSGALRARKSPDRRRTCIVIVEVSENELRHDIGLMVDAVSEVIEIPASDIEPPPSFGARIRADFIFGMGKVAGKFVIVLNIVKVLSVDEIAMLGAIAGSHRYEDEPNHNPRS
jgi:purine-binding chemotaxis protein CheW